MEPKKTKTLANQSKGKTTRSSRMQRRDGPHKGGEKKVEDDAFLKAGEDIKKDEQNKEGVSSTPKKDLKDALEIDDNKLENDEEGDIINN